MFVRSGQVILSFLFCYGPIKYSLLESVYIDAANQLFEKGGSHSQSKMLVSHSNNKLKNKTKSYPLCLISPKTKK